MLLLFKLFFFFLLEFNWCLLCLVLAPRKLTPSKAGDKADKKDIQKATPKDDKKEGKKDVGKIESSKCVTSFFKTSRYVLCLFLTKHISICLLVNAVMDCFLFCLSVET